MLKKNSFFSSTSIEYDTDDEVEETQKDLICDHYFNTFCENSFVKLNNLNQNECNATTNTAKNKSLKEKLIELYLEEKQKSLSSMNLLNYSTNLLEKLVKREQFNTLVLNLYNTNTGYSLGFNIKQKKSISDNVDIEHMNKIETKLLSYDENELLNYINYSEIPPILIDLVDRLDVNLFYDGCIILEIRDYRRRVITTIPQAYHIHFVLLQPSVQTLLTDLNSITNDGNFIWTQEDKYALESQLILANSQELCLHPSPVVSIIKNRIHLNKFKLNDRKLKRNLSKYSHAYMKRSAKWSEFRLPNPYNILKIRKKFSKSNELVTSSEAANLNNINGNTNGTSGNNNNANNSKSLKAAASSFLITSLFVDNWPKQANTSIRLPKEDMIYVKKFSNGENCHNFIFGQ